jgi:hypothetical protein
MRAVRRSERFMSVINLEISSDLLGFTGATRRIRTDDLLITNQLLYRLS